MIAVWQLWFWLAIYIFEEEISKRKQCFLGIAGPSVDFISHLLLQNYITSPPLDGGWWRRWGWAFRLGQLASGICPIKQEQCLQSWERRKFQEGDLATKSNVTEVEKDELWDETMDLTFRMSWFALTDKTFHFSRLIEIVLSQGKRCHRRHSRSSLLF